MSAPGWGQGGVWSAWSVAWMAEGGAWGVAPPAPKSRGGDASNPSSPAVEQAQVKSWEIHGWGRTYRLGAEHPNSRKPTCSGFWPTVQRVLLPEAACP